MLWVLRPGSQDLIVQTVLKSGRNALATLDYQLEVLRTDENGNRSLSRQSGLLNIKPMGTDTAGRVQINVQPGVNIEANISFTHVQEGWTLTDSIARQVGPPPVQQSKVAIDPDFLEVDGLIIDRTITKSGQDFYELFFQGWQAPLGAQGFSIILEETPWRGRQTLILVSLDEELVYQQVLQTRYDVLEEMAATAVAITNNALVNLMQSQQNRDGDPSEQIETY